MVILHYLQISRFATDGPDAPAPIPVDQEEEEDAETRGEDSHDSENIYPIWDTYN